MNDERYQKIMSDLGMPNSRSLLQALQQVANEVGQQSSEEITRLRAELAKVTWQRNEAQAGLAASRAELAHYVNRFGLWGAPLPRASLSTIHTLADQPGLDGESPA